MQVTVSGKGVDVGESLRSHVSTRLSEAIAKYIDRVTSAHVVVSRESHMFRVDINGNLGTHAGLVVKGRGGSDDVYAAFDIALDKVEKQLRRYKRRITNHNKAKPGDIAATESVRATKYVLAAHDEPAEDRESLPGVVIAEKTTDIQKLTVSEAVMRMDLEDLPALMFFNSGNGRINVVYRRADGNISWVDPQSTWAA